ncbi:MAG: cell division protein ZapA [Balneolia bacterium]|nr:cell division protein ZapA [Balneolia bacterium]
MKSIKVTILGRQYPLKVNDEDEENMHNIAQFVDERFRLFKKQLTNQNETTILVLSCLSIAEELFLAKKNDTGDSKLLNSLFFDEINRTLSDLLEEIKHTNTH